MHFLSNRQAFAIRSSDAWWQLCVLMLMYSCDAIVIDLSLVKSGTEWELNEIKSRAFLNKCMFVVNENSEHAFEDTISQYFGAIGTRQVFAYRSNGSLKDGKSFSSQLESILRIARQLPDAAVPA